MTDDLEAIRQLKARYCRFLDAKDVESWRSVFTSSPGSVRNDSPLIATSRSKRSTCCAITARSHAESAAPVWSLLNRMFSIADAVAGITLVTGLPTSMLVNCRLDG